MASRDKTSVGAARTRMLRNLNSRLTRQAEPTVLRDPSTPADFPHIHCFENCPYRSLANMQLIDQ